MKHSVQDMQGKLRALTINHKSVTVSHMYKHNIKFIRYKQLSIHV